MIKMMNCRICGASSVTVAGEVEYYAGYARQVCDCSACRCRFTGHDDSIYEVLHASSSVAYYNDYRDLAQQCRSLFDKRDREGLRALLRQTPKYRFVIDELERAPRDARVLEVGCSRGYLTSWFILDGRKILGADVSTAALEGARSNFGEHFVHAETQAVEAGAPYDFIYHVGMIGCVSDPMQLTRDLLAMLKPGGSLLFNAPNLRSCYLRGQLWLDSAPPPDVVTLFTPGFWSQHLGSEVEVNEREDMLPAEIGMNVGLRKLFRRRWNRPDLGSLSATSNLATSMRDNPKRLWQVFERAVNKTGRVTGLSRLAAPQPSEFGLYVKMTKGTGVA
ncbi:MAG TPA: class I SAM-dependent methyltransferase [Planctomycetaceae bacterium]|jgi:SAM-dependent methyltransferase|nr:class I SAM-dependent methyltransferase [Planctomycetaceae bacterium]